MYYVYYLIIKLLSLIPFKVLYVLSDLLYYPLYYVARYRRRIVRKNLTESFPDKSLDEIISIERKFYHFLMDLILESCKTMSMSRKQMAEHMKFTNMSLVNDMLRDGKSVSAYIGHYCNWEWIPFVGMWLYEGCTCAQIYHKLSNKAVDRLMRKLRESCGNVCVDMHKTARFITNAAEKQQPYVIGFISDQSPRKKYAIHYVRFLNHNVPVLVGTEKITKHYGYQAIFLHLRRVKRGYYECEFSVLHDDPKSLPDYELSDIYIKRLEEEINRHPEYYLWSHNRFRLARP